jgi:hypothetical protein
VSKYIALEKLFLIVIFFDINKVLLVGIEVEYLYKGKSYCDDCYRVVKNAVTGDST